MKEKQKGIFVVIDGLDGIGKGVCLDVFKQEAQKENFRIFDLNEYWQHKSDIPDIDEIGDVDIIITSEPTYQGIGKYVREVLTSKDQKPFSTSVVSQAYSLDRQILYERLIVPARKKGVAIFQSRSVSTSIVYQKLTGKKDGVSLEFILNLAGNKIALENAPDYLIIPTIVDVKKVMERLKNREKKDNCLFENLEFQLKAKKEYDSDSFRKIFEQRGTEIINVDVGKTLSHSIKESRVVFKNKFFTQLKSGVVFKEIQKIYPNPKTELKNWKTEFQFLVCVMLSAQTTDVQVNKVTGKLFKKFPNPSSFAKADLKDVEVLVKSLNFYKTKSKHLVETSKILIEDFYLKVPLLEKDLVKLPGVGKKTANVFLNELFHSNQGVAVDTHVARVAKRLELTREKDPLKISFDLEKLYLKKDWYLINSMFVLFGRYICKAKKPLCSECPLCFVCRVGQKKDPQI